MPEAVKKLRAVSGPITLRSPRAFAGQELKVDREGGAAGIIHNVSIIARGPALGHGFMVDDTMLKQVADAINTKPKGVKSRLTHPGIPDCGGKDGIETMLGRVTKARVSGDQVLGDVHFGKYATKSPGGDLADYCMSIAEEDPEICGLSISFDPDEFEEVPNPDYDPEDDDDEEPENWSMGRVKDVMAADFVGDPAANAGGLLSRLPMRVLGAIPRHFLDQWIESIQLKTPAGASRAPAISLSGVKIMDKKLLGLLVAMGLGASPTEEQAKTFLSALHGNDKAKLRRLCEEAGIATPPEAVEKSSPSTTQTAVVDPPATELSADDQLIKDEQTRLDRLTRMAAVYKLDEQWTNECLYKKLSMQQALESAQKALAEKNKPVTVTVGPDQGVSSLNEAVSDALILRSRPDAKFYEIHPKLRDKINPREGQLKRDADNNPIPRKPSERAERFTGLRITDMARVYFSTLGLDVNELGPVQLAALTFDRPRLMGLFSSRGIGLSEGIGDLPGVLVDAINKSLRIAYAETESTWETWCRRSTAVDFKTIHRVQLSAAPSLQAVPTGGEFVRGYFKDSDQKTALQVYGKIIGLYRQTLINDDTDAFGRIPMLIGSGCRRLENDLLYNLFALNGNAGPTMGEDGTSLFTAGHGNYTSSGTALSVASLGVAKASMRKQQAINPDSKTKARLNLIPKNLLVPAELETIADQLCSSALLIPNNTSSGSAQSQGVTNPLFKWKLNTVVEPRLSDQSATAWFLTASPNQIDTAEMIFLEGEPEPVLMERDGWNIDGRDYKYRHTLQPVVIDFRGMYKNNGA